MHFRKLVLAVLFYLPAMAKDPLDEPVTRRQLIGALRPSAEYAVTIICEPGTTNCSLVEITGKSPRPVRDGEEAVARVPKPQQEKVLCRFQRFQPESGNGKNKSKRPGDKR